MGLCMSRGVGDELVTWWARRGLPPGKLSPPRSSPELLERPRVHAALDELADDPMLAVLVVTGPAGAGKTTAVAQWLAARSRSSAWVTLDAADADAATLVRHTLGALAGPSFLPEPRVWPQPHEPIDARAWWIEHVVLPLAGEGAPVVLVLDDVHALGDAPSPGVAALAALLRDAPPRLRVVLVGQQLPPLPLARREAAGAVGRLPPAALWFSAQESDALLCTLLGPTCSVAERAELHARSEGWPAALRLLALARSSWGEASSRRALDFVVEEVLDRQALERREFLLDTVVVERLTPPLGAALAGCDEAEAEAMLWALADAGLLTVLGEGAGFRVHPLLHEALRRRLAVAVPSRTAELQRRASRWFAAHGRLDEALHHAEASGDGALLAELAAAHGFALLRARRMGQLARLLDAIAKPQRRCSPLLSTLEAWVALRHPPQVAREALERARATLAEAPATTPSAVPLATLRASLDALEIFVSLRLGEPPADLDARLAADAGLPTGLAVALAVGAGLAAERADDLPLALTRLEHAARLALAPTSPLPSGITALAHRVRVLRRSGACDLARRASDEGLAAIERHGWSAWPVAAELTLELAMVELDEGQLDAAEARATASLHALRLGDDPAVVARGLLGLAMIRRARSDHAGATDAAAQAEAAARDAGIPFLVAAARQVLEAAAATIPRAAAAPGSEPMSTRELEVLRLVAQGLSNQVVARRLFISPVTVKTHVHHILAKLTARNRTEAVHRARALGLLA